MQKINIIYFNSLTAVAIKKDEQRLLDNFLYILEKNPQVTINLNGKSIDLKTIKNSIFIEDKNIKKNDILNLKLPAFSEEFKELITKVLNAIPLEIKCKDNIVKNLTHKVIIFFNQNKDIPLIIVNPLKQEDFIPLKEINEENLINNIEEKFQTSETLCIFYQDKRGGISNIRFNTEELFLAIENILDFIKI